MCLRAEFRVVMSVAISALKLCSFVFSSSCLYGVHVFLYAHLETVCIMWLGMAGRHPHRFPHNNFSSVYQIFTKLSHM